MKKLSLMILAGFVAFSCAKDPAELGNGQGKAGVSVTFNTGDFAQVGTRATSESAIKDVTVLQFINGKLAVAPIVLEDQLFDRSVSLSGLLAMPATTLDEKGGLVNNGTENVILFVANYKVNAGAIANMVVGTTTYASLGDVATRLKFKKADAAAINAMEYIPMTGFYFGGIVAGATNQINVSMTRAMAKINFTLNTDNFKVDGKAANIYINSLSLCDVPTEVTVFNANRPALPVGDAAGLWPSAQMPYPTYSAADFVTLDPTMNLSTGDKNRTFVAYMPENGRGTLAGAVVSNKDKYPGFPGALSTTTGMSYILVNLTYTTTEGVAKDATYKIFLGGNDKSDMNIIQNTQYNVTTFLNGVVGANGTGDTRITTTPIFDATTTTGGMNFGTLVPQPNANSYMIDATALPTNFTIPIGQARIGWDYITRNAVAEAVTLTDDLTTFKTLIAGPDWEIITLWKTWAGSEKISGVKSAGITGGANGESNYFATLSFDAGIPQGNNAVIALVDKNDHSKIYWTWHLWFTDYKPSATGSVVSNGEVHQYSGQAFTSAGNNYGKYMMDRNFGATYTGGAITDAPALAADAPKLYGMMYQWGRKDPFTPNVDGSTATTTDHAVKIYKADGTQWPVAADGAVVGAGKDGFPKVQVGDADVVLATSVQNPMSYFYKAVAGDWTKQNDGLWSKTAKTVFDPCPAGWRVPNGGGTDAAYNVWSGFNGMSNTGSVGNPAANYTYVLGTGFTTTGLAPENPTIFQYYSLNTTTNSVGLFSNAATNATNGRMYVSNGIKAWYPASGYRLSASGAFNNVGTNGYAWSSSVTSTYGYYLFFYATYVNPANSTNRANGFPVRCIQE